MKALTTTLLFLALSLSLSQLYTLEWETFKLKYSKSYDPTEELYRYRTFLSNLELIKEYQSQDPDAEYGITKFADLTPEEFQRRYLGLNTSQPLISPPLDTIEDLFWLDIPDSLDWRQLGAVTTPKAQAICGSCWAFSAVGNIEGQYFLKQNSLRNLSEQELVDCDNLDQGCDGGYMQNAFTWLSQNGGLEPSENYPYFGIQGTCKINPGMQIVKVKGYLNISEDEEVIAEALYTYGPLSTGINGIKLQFYNSGIFSPKVCANTLDHGVLFVGYGSEAKKGKTTDYWIVKNSWGEDWGEEGYFRIERGVGKCGINTDVSTAVLE